MLQVSPFRRRYRTGMRDISLIAEPLDRAARGVRAVLRQVVAVARNREPVPAALLDLVEQLSSACALLAADVAAERPLDDAVDALDAVARASATVPRSSLPSDVILGQLRSTVVDLFQVAGLDIDESRARMPPPRGQHPLATHRRTDRLEPACSWRNSRRPGPLKSDSRLTRYRPHCERRRRLPPRPIVASFAQFQPFQPFSTPGPRAVRSSSVQVGCRAGSSAASVPGSGGSSSSLRSRAGHSRRSPRSDGRRAHRAVRQDRHPDKGEPVLNQVTTTGAYTADELLALAAAAEADSEHPLARAIVAAAAGRGVSVPRATEFRSATAVGVSQRRRPHGQRRRACPSLRTRAAAATGGNGAGVVVSPFVPFGAALPSVGSVVAVKLAGSPGVAGRSTEGCWGLERVQPSQCRAVRLGPSKGGQDERTTRPEP